MATRTNSSALRALAVEYKSLQEEPVEGFCVKLVNEDNLFEWEVAIFGPPDTLYMGGCFKVERKFCFAKMESWWRADTCPEERSANPSRGVTDATEITRNCG